MHVSQPLLSLAVPAESNKVQGALNRGAALHAYDARVAQCTGQLMGDVLTSLHTGVDSRAVHMADSWDATHREVLQVMRETPPLPSVASPPHTALTISSYEFRQSPQGFPQVLKLHTLLCQPRVALAHKQRRRRAAE